MNKELYQLNELLNTKKDTTGQKRTGIGKKFVVYKSKYPEVVFKGPYSKYTLPYQATFERAAILKKLNAQHIIFPEGYAKCDNTVNNDGKPCRAIVFPNLIGELSYDQKVIENIENIESFGNNYRYNVRDRNPNFMKLAHYIETTKNFSVLDNYELLRTYVLLFILETGDVGLHNTMVTVDGDDVEVNIIDYEDNRVVQRDDATFYFNKPCSPKYHLEEHFTRYYKQLAAELYLMRFDVDRYEKRKTDAIHYLEKYATNKHPAKTMTNKSKVQTILVGGKVAPLVAPKVYEKDEPRRGPGKMLTTNSMKGHTLSFHGHKPGVIKSALQKNIRRGFTHQAIFSAFEMWLFQCVDATWWVNNMYNRLRIIACEDLTPQTLQIQAYVCRWVELWTHQGKQPSYKIDDVAVNISLCGVSAPPKYNPVRLAGIVHALSDAPKSRIASYLYNAYTRPEGIAKLRELDIHVDSLQLNIVDVDAARELKLPFLTKDDYTIDNGNMAASIGIIYKRLMTKDPNAVRWLNHFLVTYEKTKVSGRKRANAPIIMWELFGLFIIKDILEPIRDSYYDATETRPIWMCVVCNIIVGVRDMSFHPNLFDQYVAYYRDPGESVVQQCLNGNYTLEILDYMLDKHTGKKGDAVALQQQFVLEGAQVNNQDPVTFSPILKEIYETLPPKKAVNKE